MNRRVRLFALCLALLMAPLARSQTTLRGVLPGQSDAAAVARAIGQPTKMLSATLAEHDSGDNAAKLFVQYQDGIVARIELVFPAGRAQAQVLTDVNIGSGRAREQKGALGRVEALFDDAAVVINHRGNSADTPVISVACYSRTLYDTTFGREPSTPPPPPRVIQTDGSLIGCFRDTSEFDLDGLLERSAHNTPQRCIATCTQHGFAFAGVQYGESCLCGNSYGRYGTATNCDYPCTGDPGAICGGYNANSIYRTSAAPATPLD